MAWLILSGLAGLKKAVFPAAKGWAGFTSANSEPLDRQQPASNKQDRIVVSRRNAAS
jgi:hypothetical protein